MAVTIVKPIVSSSLSANQSCYVEFNILAQNMASTLFLQKLTIPSKTLVLEKNQELITKKKNAWNNYHGFDVLFESALCLEANKQYTLVSVFKGLISWYGLEGQTTVESGGVQFTFSESNCDFNNTSVTRGQFPALIFS